MSSRGYLNKRKGPGKRCASPSKEVVPRRIKEKKGTTPKMNRHATAKAVTAGMATAALAAGADTPGRLDAKPGNPTQWPA